RAGGGQVSGTGGGSGCRVGAGEARDHRGGAGEGGRRERAVVREDERAGDADAADAGGRRRGGLRRAVVDGNVAAGREAADRDDRNGGIDDDVHAARGRGVKIGRAHV